MNTSHFAVASAIRRAVAALDFGPATLLQVGACEGQRNDPVWPLIGPHKKWKFIRVEPRLDIYDRLSRRHINDLHVATYQAAVIPDEQAEGPVVLYEFEHGDGGRGWEGVCSFDRDILQRHVDVSEAETGLPCPNKIVETTVRGVHFEHLLRWAKCEKPDIVVTDMEAYDYLVVEPSIAMRVPIISFEHTNMDDAKNEALTTALKDAGYECVHEGPKDAVWSLTKE